MSVKFLCPINNILYGSIFSRLLHLVLTCTMLPHCYTPPFCNLLPGKRGGGDVTTRTCAFASQLSPPPPPPPPPLPQIHVLRSTKLSCAVEDENSFDRHAVAVLKDNCEVKAQVLVVMPPPPPPPPLFFLEVGRIKGGRNNGAVRYMYTFTSCSQSEILAANYSYPSHVYIIGSA